MATNPKATDANIDPDELETREWLDALDAVIDLSLIHI